MLEFLKKILNKNKVNSVNSPVFKPLDKNIISLFNQNRVAGSKPVLCYAPFSNMYFDPQGNVYSCCLSWESADKIENKSISQFWNGGKLKTLRNYIKNNDLSYSCKICNSHLQNKNFHLALINMFDEFSSEDFNYPKMMEFELSNICNLECIMCNGRLSSSIRRNKDKLPPLPVRYNDNFIEQIEKFIPHLQKARFIGGEPFLIDIYYKIWEKIISINPSVTISLSTNGTVLNDKIKNILGRGRFEIIFSIDSINKQNYENIRKNAVYEEVMNNLYFFRDYCIRKNTFFNISVCPLRQNWFELPEILLFCNKFEIHLFFNTVIEPYECALWSLSGEELGSIYSKLLKIEIPVTSQVEKHNHGQYNDLLNQIKIWKERAYLREKNKLLSENTDDKAKKIFVEKLRTYIFEKNKINEEEKEREFKICEYKINEIISNLPEFVNQTDLFALMNNSEMSLMSEKFLNSEVVDLTNEAKSIITDYYYNN